MTEHTAQGRFQKLNRPATVPGRCVYCLVGTKPVFDANVNIKMYGRVYVCVDCASEMGVETGLMPKELSDELLAANERLVLRVAELEQEIADHDFDPDDALNARLVAGLSLALRDPSVVSLIQDFSRSDKASVDDTFSLFGDVTGESEAAGVTSLFALKPVTGDDKSAS